MFEKKDALDAKSLLAAMGPGAVDQQLRQAVTTCWMLLPNEEKNIDRVRSEINRILDRLFDNMKEDEERFRQ